MDILGHQASWAPSGPSVRDQLNDLNPKLSISPLDWYAGIDPAKWRQERKTFRSSRPVIGGAGPPTDEAWPDNAADILSAYPDDQRMLVRILDGGDVLRRYVGPYPRNWEVVTSDNESEHEFFSSIDFFVHSHHPSQINPIDTGLIKAMASGAVSILPPSFEPIFDEAVIYAEPHQISSKVLELYANRSSYQAMSEAGVKAITEKFSTQNFVDRINNLIGQPECSAANYVAVSSTRDKSPSRLKRRVMFITINGVGMGHLTRMLAIAKRCPKPIEPVFVTMSQALKVLRQQGYLAEFIPSRQYLNCNLSHWNGFLRDELNEMISFYDPAVVIFDGNVPYQGLIEAIKNNPDPWYIWSRRGMWRSDNTEIVSRERYFDVVLEPGDLASADDHGITTRHRDRTYEVRPIRLLAESEMLSRDAARRELGLAPEKTAVLIQLGAGNNFDYRSIHNTALSHINHHHDAQIAVGEWLISDQPIDLPETVVRMPGYPFARYFKAFDIAISATGYNSFHELLFAGIPTILVPNEAMEQDNQLARALFADRHGLSVCVRTREIYRLTAMIDKLFRPDERDLIKSRLAALEPTNGATDAAQLIEELAFSRRVDQP